MASENETFDEVLRCMQNDIVHFVGKPVKHSRDLLQEYHDRFKAAHRREVAELRECIGTALEVVDSTAEKLGVINSVKSCEEYKMWRKVLETTKGAEDEGE